ncbi:MAG TPA: DEAD/DEAH box helicase [bacterium]|nr:DEAD/DEAH box helicase [bacterium]
MNDLRGSVSNVISSIHHSSLATGITACEVFPETPATTTDLPDHLHAGIRTALKHRGIHRLYSHQTQALQAFAERRDTIVVTPTASGKTLCYNLPVLNELLNNPGHRALYLFPTKALAQDQYHEFSALIRDLDSCLILGTYDGDTPSDQRKQIRESASVILTNPDMLHAGILPHHSRWHRFFQNLSVVVIDELHHYRGVFGSHFCNVLRRLKRVCRFHGSNPCFLMSSATLANPESFAERMIGRPVTLIDRSGAPSGKRTFFFYNPPVVDAAGMIRRSYLDEVVRFARVLINGGIQTIVFARSRHNVELLLKQLRQVFELPEDSEFISGYRGGYLPGERRAIEKGLREGKIRCVITTSALELGIDIGDMGAAILAGYPGTIASTWQRAGRAGRRENESVAVLVASAAPLDQFMVHNPSYFFDRPAEHGLINPDNLLILLEHIRCAAFEIPFEREELYDELKTTGEFLEYLDEEGAVNCSGDRWFYTGGGYPAERISLRSVSPDNVLLADVSGVRPEIIGEVDTATAPILVHPEAIYLHGARTYLVEKLDLDAGRADLRPMDPGYFTVPQESIRISVIEESRSVGPSLMQYGDLQVITQVVGYKKLKFSTRENLGAGSVTLPEQELLTTGVWAKLPMAVGDVMNSGQVREIAAGFTGALTAIHSVASVMLMCDPRDIGSCVSGGDGDWTARMDHLGTIQLAGHPTDRDRWVCLYIYDRYPGGIGLCEQLVRMAGMVVSEALRITERCDCRFGCPACIGPVSATGMDVKHAAVSVLRFFVESPAVPS